ncbi:MAG: hypothetical protein MJY94_01295 [Bacteroidales bacterium]|nr:hypothetical protein [Bacteroidales bacterium]
MDIVPIESLENWFWRFLHLVLNGKSKTPTRGLNTYISSKTIKRLKAINSDAVLMLGAIDFRMAHVISHCIPRGVDKAIWVWNEVGKDNYEDHKWAFTHYKELGIRTFSYNPADVDTYGLEYIPQVYRYVDGLFKGIAIEQDCYWVGRPKGRTEHLLDISAELDMAGLSYKFMVIERSEDAISYLDNLKEISASRCLVDFYNATNEGVSLRVMEALFLKKKLITTNRFVTKYDFYNPQNIFIWGVDNPEKLGEFVRSTFVPVAKEIVSRYDINNWIKNFQ